MIVKFSDSEYSIISAYGNERVQVELTEHPITFEELIQFVNSVIGENIEVVRQFISQYFLSMFQR